MEWYHVWWPRVTSKRVARFVSDIWVTIFYILEITSTQLQGMTGTRGDGNRCCGSPVGYKRNEDVKTDLTVMLLVMWIQWQKWIHQQLAFESHLRNDVKWKKALRETQTLRAALVGGAKNFHPAADPLPRGAGPPKFNQLEMVTTCTYRYSLVKIDARNFELSW